ncbi:bactofilin family protein [Thiohalorhabdus sp. Cl-TMA]|uniref:Polymer-forming cytoskeletal protein n=1 Tax=Thiohalorhabdus methylotrophus TaxID=3242694 RepID=A0ABV4TQW4_9GAMM
MIHKKRKVNTGGTLETMIGAGTSVKGDVTFEGGLRVDGTLEGTITAPDGSGSRLVISDQAEIRGEVQVPNVVINGRVIGNVHASERLELHAQSSVEGDLYYEVIQMEEGAGITGTCSHISTTKQGKTVAAPATENQLSGKPEVLAGGNASPEEDAPLAARAKTESG